MSAQVSLYYRGDEVVVIPQGGGGGFSYDIEPSRLVRPEPAEVGAAVIDALESSRQAQGQASPASSKASDSALLKKLKAARKLKKLSFPEFYKGASQCLLQEDEGILFLLKMKPSRDGKGFELDGPEKTITMDRVGYEVLECLRNAARMP
jgi:hypothetical protein